MPATLPAFPGTGDGLHSAGSTMRTCGRQPRPPPLGATPAGTRRSHGFGTCWGPHAAGKAGCSSTWLGGALAGPSRHFLTGETVFEEAGKSLYFNYFNYNLPGEESLGARYARREGKGAPARGDPIQWRSSCVGSGWHICARWNTFRSPTGTQLQPVFLWSTEMHER